MTFKTDRWLSQHVRLMHKGRHIIILARLSAFTPCRANKMGCNLCSTWPAAHHSWPLRQAANMYASLADHLGRSGAPLAGTHLPARSRGRGPAVPSAARRRPPPGRGARPCRRCRPGRERAQTGCARRHVSRLRHRARAETCCRGWLSPVPAAATQPRLRAIHRNIEAAYCCLKSRLWSSEIPGMKQALWSTAAPALTMLH